MMEMKIVSIYTLIDYDIRHNYKNCADVVFSWQSQRMTRRVVESLNIVT